MLNLLLAVLLLPVVAINVIGPWLVLRTQRIPARVRFNNTDHARFLADRGEVFRRLDEQLQALQFAHIGSSVLPSSHTTSHFSLYVHPRDQAAAMLVTMTTGKRRVTYAEFTQLYADGSLLDVHNAPSLSSYPAMPCRIGVRMTGVNNLKRLFSTLQHLRARLPNSAAAIAYPEDQGFAPIERFLARESDELVAQGYCTPDIDSQGRRGLTLKGALLLTWKNAWPGRLVFNLLEQRHTRLLLTDSAP
ncbi:hypothetical protein [Halopseudomonas aestusnigri]|uniref:Uncharacterized protein n=1 Tax=Halopseudomonas aestusnigri TaxID=857252 RepID=A0AAQ1JND7_9GAMM|nr:hypothetical protein [Halopseudomonas aestusnigri]OWL90787.1 hypothetical protein B7O88_00325 [Halopseudomonas aestusnigri]SEF44242.1 hypothetical protein SAMN05216586_10166 [Halopseudomonas aestusnigri]